MNRKAFEASPGKIHSPGEIRLLLVSRLEILLRARSPGRTTHRIRKQRGKPRRRRNGKKPL